MTLMNKIFLFILFFSSLTTCSYSQIDTSKKEQAFTMVEQMPSFPGGEVEMMKFIQKNVVYPQYEKEKGISGTCYVTFVIEKDGSVDNITVLRGVPNGFNCDKEAMRVVSIMPKWTPGKQNGQEVRVQFNLPIKFTSIQYVAPAPLKPEDREKISMANAHYNKGVGLAKKDEFEKAMSEFEEVLKIFPKDAEALYNKGYMCYKLNRKEEACTIWQNLKNIGSSIADNMLKECDTGFIKKDSIK
jgi:TonB family protein